MTVCCNSVTKGCKDKWLHYSLPFIFLWSMIFFLCITLRHQVVLSTEAQLDQFELNHVIGAVQ